MPAKNARTTRTHLRPESLDRLKAVSGATNYVCTNFGIGKKAPIYDCRLPNQGIKTKFHISELFIGTTATVSPHFDDASLNYGGGIYTYATAGGEIHTINVTSGHKAPIMGVSDADIAAKVGIRVAEGKAESGILGSRFHFLDLRELYTKKLITSTEASIFYAKLDGINPATLVIPGPFDTHPDHQNSRILALNWAADQARRGWPKVIVEAPSVWGSIPEIYLTHMLRLDDESRRARSKAQGAHLSQSRRTDFPAAARYLALARGIVAGELVYGLVEKTPKLGQVEWYSQHVVMQEGGNTVFRRRD